MYYYCYKHRIINCRGSSIYKTTKALLLAVRYLKEEQRSYSYTAPNKATVVA
jgi:hypothetical protein